MALDPERFKRFRKWAVRIAGEAPIEIGEKRTEALMQTVFGDALEGVEELIDGSRPPRLYVFGRSGAGKSSLINALADKQVADVGAIEPETVESEMYHIPFPEQYASWDVIDSRGLFESVTPAGERPEPTSDGIPDRTYEFIKGDLQEYRPDIVIHVMTPDQVRAGSDDFRVVKQLQEEIGGPFPPVVYCINKVDTHIGPGDDWPPEENPALLGEIKANLDFVAQVIEKQHDETIEKTPFRPSQPHYGYRFGSENHLGVFPTYLRQEPYWNDDTIAQLIGDFLPDSARLQFAQPQAEKRDKLMRDLSRDVTNRFAVAAGGVGSAPVPVGDIVVLTAMQTALIGIVGSFSCRELGRESVEDYLAAMGGTTIAALTARGVARSLIQMVPVAGTAVSAGVASATTWAIGRSAEEYFFNDRIRTPSGLLEEGKKRFS